MPQGREEGGPASRISDPDEKFRTKVHLARGNHADPESSLAIANGNLSTFRAMLMHDRSTRNGLVRGQVEHLTLHESLL